ncbi:MAG: transcription factor Pcc1-domain-containing protein [Monoraphidium minutum]|nr:MAG: transcription factor Pcc1-domain-containing protein [Monoraphidium minutum]
MAAVAAPDTKPAVVESASAAAAAAAAACAAAGGDLPGKVQQANELCYTFEGSVDLRDASHASAVLQALQVDPELNPGQVSRDLRVEGSTLHISFAATELRLLRAAVSTFYDLLALATRAAEQFGAKQ